MSFSEQPEKGSDTLKCASGAAGSVTPSALDIALNHEALAAAGNAGCAVGAALRAATLAHHITCGKCTFGREGTRQLMDVLHDMTTGKARPNDIELLIDLCGVMKDGSLCENGRNASDAVLLLITKFRSEFEAHLKNATAPGHVCSVLSTPATEGMLQ